MEQNTRAQRYIFSLKLANKLKTEFKRKVQAHNKKQMLYLTASSFRIKVKSKKLREELTKKTKTNLNLSTNLLLMRYLSFSSPPSYSFSSPFSFRSDCNNTKDVHVRKLHLKSVLLQRKKNIKNASIIAYFSCFMCLLVLMWSNYVASERESRYFSGRECCGCGIFPK